MHEACLSLVWNWTRESIAEVRTASQINFTFLKDEYNLIEQTNIENGPKSYE